MICQSCERGKHNECEFCWVGAPCDCLCQGDVHFPSQIDPDYATDEKLTWADLRRKERKER